MKIIKIQPAFTDERGEIFDLLTTEKVDHVGMLTSKKGSIRGKHYHKIQKQYTFVLSGKLKIVTKDVSKDGSKLEEFEIKENEMVVFPPYCYHSLEALVNSIVLVFTTKSRVNGGYEDDTFRIENINSL